IANSVMNGSPPNEPSQAASSRLSRWVDCAATRSQGIGMIPAFEPEPRAAEGEPRDDGAELQADEVASRVAAGADAGPIEPLAGGATTSLDIAPDRRGAVDGSTAGGEPLEPALRERLEPRFARDFSHVRIHSDGRAAAAAAALRAD